jgi:hypothetical protein
LTNPVQPIFTNITPYFTNNSVHISWLIGTGANRTVIVKSLTSYSDEAADGTVVYNGTGTDGWVENISFNTSTYFTLFSFTVWGDLSRWSSGVDVPWGGVTFIVYNFSRPWQMIAANVLVTDSSGINPVNFTNVYGYYNFNISQIPYGDNTLFYVSNSSYYSQLYVLDIEQSVFYNFTFYLMPLHPPGWNTTPGNVSASYMVQIWNQYQYPVPNARVEFYHYFNTTANFTYIGGFVSDGNGQGSIFLLPFNLYQIKIYCDGFIDSIENFWTPNIIDQGLIKQFMIYPLEQPKYLWDNISSTIDPLNRNQYGSFTFYFNMTSLNGELEWFSAQVYRINNVTGALTSLYLGNFSTAAGGSLSYTVTNTTGRYYFKCQFKKDGFDTYKFGDQTTYTYFLLGIDNSISDLEDKLELALGRSPVYIITVSGETVVSYIAIIAMFVLIVGLFTFSPRFAGLAIIALGLLLGFLKGPLGLMSDVIMNWAVAGFIIVLGFILAVTKKKEEEAG